MHLVRGSGATLTDSTGRTFIDAYNNVPVVGHAHPRVSGAIADQARLLSTNLRYLHPRAIELAERLVATMPGAGSTPCCCSTPAARPPTWPGAWRRPPPAAPGALVTDFAYHGVTTATAAPSRPRSGVVAGGRGTSSGSPPARGADPTPGRSATAVGRLRDAGPRAGARRGRHRSTPATGSWRPERRTTTALQRRPARRAPWSWPTRCRPASAGPATTCGRSSARAWTPTSSRWASRWATATRSPRWSPAAATSRRSAARPSSSAPSRGSPVAAVAALGRARRHRGRRPGRARGRDGPAAARAGCGRPRPAARPCATVRGRGLLVGVDLAGTAPDLWPPCRTGPASRAC